METNTNRIFKYVLFAYFYLGKNITHLNNFTDIISFIAILKLQISL